MDIIINFYHTHLLILQHVELKLFWRATTMHKNFTKTVFLYFFHFVISLVFPIFFIYCFLFILNCSIWIKNENENPLDKNTFCYGPVFI